MAEGDKTYEKRAICKDDFIFEDELGAGAYSRVVLTTFRATGKKYATKIIQKSFVLREKKVKTVQMEKKVLNIMDHENIIKLFCTYQDKDNLYFALELAPGGEMFSYLSKYGPFTFEAAQFYTAEIVNGLEYMHGLGIIHRDLKPENIIFTKDMHAKITDFGTAKMRQSGTTPTSPEEDEVNSPKQSEQSRQTFCGTAEYVSPEVLTSKPVTEGADLWALGCMIYQFFTGKYPFKGESTYLMFQSIQKGEIDFPQHFPMAARDLVVRLLKLEPEDRLGMGPDGYKYLKSHSFFEGINFSTLSQITPPSIVPKDSFTDNVLSNSQEIENDRWSLFLLKNENVFYSRLIIKRRRLTAKRRQLIVTDRPRLLYIDPDTMALKGIIPWSAQLWVQKKSDRDFVVHTPNRKYVLESLDDGADGWINAIETLQKRDGYTK
ncbi:3-phosphoinositide-dependent protein kinase [Acrasis kona]|uniref:non-specific serine/threonine protein kinase n=1 Tax=Acrasis kona TaxID=1008807 RepID=A0AAW2ZDQ8_9EUKA